MNIKLVEVKDEKKELLWNMLQKYLYEMTNFYYDIMDEDGNYPYRFFDEYFSDSRRKAYFIHNDEALVGFVLLNPYSSIGKNPDFTIAEFTIFPAYRRKHIAIEAAKAILDKHPGIWEIKYNDKNEKAKRLWNTVAAPYGPKVVSIEDYETVLTFSTEIG